MSKYKQLTTEEPIYSYHAFLFPFEWSYLDGADKLFEEQTSLKALERLMSKAKDWERRRSWAEPQTVIQYNENAYFYGFTKPALYDTGKDDSMQFHYHYRIENPDGNDNLYEIECHDSGQSKPRTYRLQIDDIILCFYNTGVGYIAFSLYNKQLDQSHPEDILTINNLGRKLYPPFFASDNELIGQQAFFEVKSWKEQLNTTKEIGQLAKSIRLKVNNETIVDEDYSRWHINQDINKEPDFIEKLLATSSLKDILKIKPVLDDRMFTVCWYGNHEIVNQMKRSENDQTYLENEWWYRYVFVDGSTIGCSNPLMRKNLIEQATNPRWSTEGTFYGVSRYSFVALTSQFSENRFAINICSHMQTMYYKIALLSLVQRSCMLHFSNEISAISNLPRSAKKVAPRVSSLYKKYIAFVNKVYFREVTAQEQGIELYDMLQQQMRLEKQIKDLNGELQELHQYATMLEEKERTAGMNMLTIIGAVLAVPALLSTYWGIVDFKVSTRSYYEILLLAVMFLIPSAITLGIAFYRGSTRMIFVILLIVALAGIMILTGNTEYNYFIIDK